MRGWRGVSSGTLLWAASFWGGAAAAQPPAELEVEIIEVEASEAAPGPDEEEARARAEQYRERAEKFERFGGAGYKTGVVRAAEERAERFEAQAKRAASEEEGAAEATPQAAEAAEEVSRARGLGGAAYKTGTVARAEEEARRQGAPTGVVTPVLPEESTGRPLGTGKPIELELEPPKSEAGGESAPR